MLNIILADDDTLVREGFKLLLKSDENFNVIGEASNGLQVVEMVENGLSPDIIISDMNMPGLDGNALIRPIKEINENIKVVILSMIDSKKTVEQAFSAGAWGYLLKAVHPEELMFALKQVSKGTKYLCSILSVKLLTEAMERSNTYQPEMAMSLEFTSRELQVLQLITDGLTNSEMSEKLFLSKRTIEGHRQSLIEKTGCKNTASLVKFAVQNGIIQ